MKPLIRKIHWNAHHNCNMKCQFCYLWRQNDSTVLTTEEALYLLKQAADANIEWFVFGGGDPLLRRDLAQLIIHAKQLGLRVDLQTNAILLTNEFLGEVHHCIDKIGLSLDGCDDITHDSVRDYPGHFQIVLAALERCEQLSIPVVIRTTVCKLNLGSLGSLGNLLDKYRSVVKWSIREFVPLGLGQQNRNTFYVSRKEFITEVNRIRMENVERVKTFPIIPITADEMKNCYGLVSQNGSFYTHPPDGIYYSYGKFPQESLNVILSHLKYDFVLRKLRDNKENHVHFLEKQLCKH